MLDEIAAGVPSHVTADLTATPRATKAEMAERMSGNLCRCGAYSNIAEAMAEVAGEPHEALQLPHRDLARAGRGDGRGDADARFIAGGTNLLDLMKLEIEAPAHLVDVNGLGLDRIEATEDGGLRIGALVSNTDLAADARVRRDYGVLARAILAGASGQLRNKATTAGNLMQRTRCRHQPGLQQAQARIRLHGDRRL